jgi:SagB-type dehydrogenase family enzyme
MRKALLCIFLFVAVTLTAQTVPTAAAPQSGGSIALPAAAHTGGMSLNEALATRRSVRSFEETKITMEEIGQLLWSAQGVTSDKAQRTAPSAHALYFLHLYVARAEGFFEYIPALHALQPISEKDLRATLSTQETVKKAPVVFLIAGEYERAARGVERATAERLVNLEAGHAAQNLLLEATALKLGAVPVGGIDPKQTAAAAGLPAGIVPVYLIPVGHPKK